MPQIIAKGHPARPPAFRRAAGHFDHRSEKEESKAKDDNDTEKQILSLHHC